MAVGDPHPYHVPLVHISPQNDFIITPSPTGKYPMSEEVSPSQDTDPNVNGLFGRGGDATKLNAFVQFIASQQVNYKFDEGRILNDIKQYIDKTYTAHYGNRKYQATDMIIDAGHGESFCIGNVMKYSLRYGKKDGKNKADLLKIVHYAIMAIYLNELEEKGTV